jgi:nucleoside triphosphate diphosphatase
MQDNSALGRITELVRDLRIRCPWDRAQTRQTLRPYLVEEVLELDQAIAADDAGAIRDEAGDFLLHLAWQIVLGEELGEFTADRLADEVERKMHRRHPHLFDIGPAESWETLKRRERPARERQHGTLDGLPPTLPGLLMASRLQERSAAVGFDWPDTAGPAAKVREELAEVEAELAQGAPFDALEGEIGDLLFAVVNLARKAGVQAGGALDRANRKFHARFAAVEMLAAERGLSLETAGLDRLDELWNEVKVSAGPA